MKEKKVHLSDPQTGKTLCGIPLTDSLETTQAVSSMTCKRCERTIYTG